jgi:hypothetical protein
MQRSCLPDQRRSFCRSRGSPKLWGKNTKNSKDGTAMKAHDAVMSMKQQTPRGRQWPSLLARREHCHHPGDFPPKIICYPTYNSRRRAVRGVFQRLSSA